MEESILITKIYGASSYLIQKETVTQVIKIVFQRVTTLERNKETPSTYSKLLLQEYSDVIIHYMEKQYP